MIRYRHDTGRWLGAAALGILLCALAATGCGRSPSSSVVTSGSRTSIFAQDVPPEGARPDSGLVADDARKAEPPEQPPTEPPRRGRPERPKVDPEPPAGRPEPPLLPGEAGDSTQVPGVSELGPFEEPSSADSTTWSHLPIPPPKFREGAAFDSLGRPVPGAAGPADSLAGAPDSLTGLTDTLAALPPVVDEVDTFVIPDSVRQEVYLATDSTLLARRVELPLWAFAEEEQPTRDALLYTLTERQRLREIMRTGEYLRSEEKAVLDTTQIRLLQPDAPRLAGTDKVHHSVTVDVERGSVQLANLYEGTPVEPPVHLSLGEYHRRLTGATVRRLWGKAASTDLQRERGSQEGLVDLDLPVTIPKGLTSVFGKGKPNLKVSGSERITFSGKSRWFPNQVVYDTGRRQSKFPQLNMEQELNLRLEGSIGDKVKVDVNQSSESTTPLANRIQIHYEGYEDEILQRVDLGNTSLRLPGTQYVTFNGKAEGLFGINALARVGDVDLNMILSKQEGRNDSKSVSSRAEKRTIRIEDFEYLKAQYFFLRDPDGCPFELDPITLQVYLDDKRVDNNTELGAIDAAVTADGEPPTGAEGEALHEGSYHLLSPEGDYVIEAQIYAGYPVIRLTRPLEDNHYLAVTYAGWELVLQGTELVRSVPFAVGHSPTLEDPSATLKMMRPSRSDPAVNQENLRLGAWGRVSRLEMRNVYDLGGRNILPDGFDIKVRRTVTSGTNINPDRLDDGTTFLRMLGVDLSEQGNEGARPGHDGQIDSEFISYTSGILILPDLRPFDPDSTDFCLEPAVCPGYSYCRFNPDDDPRKEDRPDSLGAPKWFALAAGEYRAPGIYDRVNLTPNESLYSRYYFDITYLSPVTNIQLNAFNILQGSERVTAGGRVLQRDVHYRIDYEIGEVEILEAAGVTETDQIDVSYQYVPFAGGGSQKTLAGVSAFVKPEESKWNASSTWFFESKGGVPGLEGNRPRLGEEPSRTLVGEFAGTYRTDSWLLTDLVDGLPYIDARQPSRFELESGIGMSLPNPNTKNVLYIDDFEGAKDVLTVTLNRQAWRAPAVPVEVLQEEGFLLEPAAARKGELLWYTPTRALQEWDLQPTRESREGDDNKQMLEMFFAPRGATPDERRRSWVGITQPLSARGVDLSRAQFLDIWINDGIPYERREEREGKLYLDLGTVSEDAIWHRNDLFADPATWQAVVPPNLAYDSEDENEDGKLDQNSNVNEDTGLDRLANHEGDVSFDDYDFGSDDFDDEHYQPREYRFVNGTEGNQSLDSEDLNGDGSFDRFNAYFQVELDLADPTLWETDVRRDFVVGDPGQPLTQQPADSSGWRRLRVSLANEELVKILKDAGVTDPSWERIFHLRLWTTGFSGERERLQIGGVEIIGNRWYEQEISDLRDVPLPDTSLAPGEDFFVGVLNNKDDRAVYSPPFTPRDRPEDNVQEREQSITLELRNFQPGHRAGMYRTFPRDQDYSSLYETLEFFLNRRFAIGEADLLLSIRLSRDAASDTTNYYEYVRPLPNGWDLVRMDLATLSQLQLETPNEAGLVERDLGDGVIIRRRGNPSLTAIKRISFVVSNVGRTPLEDGNVWIDELRLTGVKKETGTASRVRMNAVLSDLGDFNANYERIGADFQRIGAERGSGSTATTLNLSSRLNLNKFIERTGIALPLRVSYAKTRRVPKFQTNSDLVVKSPTDRDISESDERTVNLSYSKRTSENKLMRYLVDPFSLGGTYTRRVDLEPTVRDTTSTRSGSVNWSLPLEGVGRFQIPTDGILGLFKRPELQLLPTNLSAGLQGSTTERTRYTRTDLSAPFVRDNRPSLTTAGLSLSGSAQPIRAVNYRIESGRDLNLQHNQVTLAGLNLGRETSRRQSLSANWDPPVLKTLFGPHLSWQGSSNLNLARQGQTVAGEPDRYNDVSNSNTTSLNGRIAVEEFSKLVRALRPGSKEDSAKVARERRASTRGGVRLSNINVRYSISRSTSFTRRKGEPNLLYQLGISGDLGSEVRGLSNRSSSESETRGFDCDASVSLPFDMSVKTRFSRKTTDSDQNGSGSATKETQWPDLDISWGRLHEQLKLNKLLKLKSLSASTGYSRKNSEQSTAGFGRDVSTTTTDFSPLLQVRATLQNNLSATLDSSSNETVRESVRPSVTVTRTSNDHVGLTFKKTFTIQRRIQNRIEQAKMDVNAGVDWRSNSNETRQAGGAATAGGKTTLSVVTGSSYSFTQRITGSANLEFGQDTDQKDDSKTTRYISVAVSASFSF